MNEQDKGGLAAEAGRLRQAGALGRSDVLMRLFDFLLECSLTGRAPKEVEIAFHVFGKVDTVDDASVRVHIHRIRRKLDEFYATEPNSERLVIPRGEYRVVLTQQAGAATEEEVNDADLEVLEPPSRRRWSHRGRFWIALGLIVTVNIAGWLLVVDHNVASPSTEVERSVVWAPLTSSKMSTFIVAGDYYIFGEGSEKTGITRLVRESGIDSQEDLDRYRMEHPNEAGQYINLDRHYLPVSTSYAMNSLLPLISSAAANSGAPLRMSLMSQLIPERLKNYNLVYIGLLSGLGLLRDPVLRASGFSVGPGYDELVDHPSGRKYHSDLSLNNDSAEPQRDYGYIASLLGPAGNRILIVAGMRGPGLKQMAEIIKDPAELAQLAKRTGSAASFEALYEVRSLGDINLDSSLLIARPLRAQGVWRPDSGLSQRLPGEMPEATRPAH